MLSNTILSPDPHTAHLHRHSHETRLYLGNHCTSLEKHFDFELAIRKSSTICTGEYSFCCRRQACLEVLWAREPLSAPSNKPAYVSKWCKSSRAGTPLATSPDGPLVTQCADGFLERRGIFDRHHGSAAIAISHPSRFLRRQLSNMCQRKTSTDSARRTPNTAMAVASNCPHSFKLIKSDSTLVQWTCNLCHSGPHWCIFECRYCKLHTCRTCTQMA